MLYFVILLEDNDTFDCWTYDIEKMLQTSNNLIFYAIYFPFPICINIHVTVYVTALHFLGDRVKYIGPSIRVKADNR